jgi:carbamoyl-phosphate synthase small subunit
MDASRLVLESGEEFTGFSPSWQRDIYFGKVVFSTGLTSYVESLTDPSYAGQILTFTYKLPFQCLAELSSSSNPLSSLADFYDL